MYKENNIIQFITDDWLWYQCCLYLLWALKAPVNKRAICFTHSGLPFCNITNVRILSIEDFCLFIDIKKSTWLICADRSHLSKAMDIIQTAIYYQNDIDNPENIINIDFAKELETTSKKINHYAYNTVKGVKPLIQQRC